MAANAAIKAISVKSISGKPSPRNNDRKILSILLPSRIPSPSRSINLSACLSSFTSGQASGSPSLFSSLKTTCMLLQVSSRPSSSVSLWVVRSPQLSFLPSPSVSTGASGLPSRLKSGQGFSALICDLISLRTGSTPSAWPSMSQSSAGKTLPSAPVFSARSIGTLPNWTKPLHISTQVAGFEKKNARMSRKPKTSTILTDMIILSEL